ncbi:ABC-2 transporter permease [Pseudoflavonifractor sp. HCP28S3_F10]|uniref:ABC-2 transporter permease n=1 Tax=Pseudoflavonifractor sp. HCP28S3_F10 TaxID=3438947 RepID=UPI003F8C93B7
MNGLLKKEFFVLRKQLRTWTMLFVLYAAIAVTGVWGPYILTTLVTVMTLMTPLSAFGYDQSTGWETFVATLPGGREKAVGARYLFCLLVDLAAAALALGLTLLLGLLGFADVALDEAAASTLSCAAVALLMIAVALPLCYKLGVEKARVVYMAVFLAAFGGGLALVNLLSGRIALPAWLGYALLAAVVPVLAVVMYLSYRTSVSILREKEY